MINKILILYSRYASTARPMWLWPWEVTFIVFSVIFLSEYSIIYLEYRIEEFLSQVVFWNVLDNLRGCAISGVNQVMHVDVFV